MSQRYQEAQQGIADADGLVVMEFSPPPSGLIFTGSLCVYNAESNGPLWTATVGVVGGGFPLGAWPAANTFGPAQALANEVITVKGTGCTIGKNYICTFNGTAAQEGESIPFVSPAATTSTTATASINVKNYISDVNPSNSFSVYTPPTNAFASANEVFPLQMGDSGQSFSLYIPPSNLSIDFTTDTIPLQMGDSGQSFFSSVYTVTGGNDAIPLQMGDSGQSFFSSVYTVTGSNDALPTLVDSPGSFSYI